MANLKILHKEEVYQLVYANSVLLLGQNNKVLISFNWINIERVFEISFTNRGDINPYSINWEIKKETPNKVFVYLNKWESDTFVENIEPLIFTAAHVGKKLFLKFRLTSKKTDINGFAKLEVTIYEK